MASATATSPESVSHPDMRRKTFLRGVEDTLPLALSAFTYGIAYGALAHSTNHLTLLQTLAMSALVYAGASQFAILSLIHQGTALMGIVGGVALINARQILYGFSLGPALGQWRLRSIALLAHWLTDETYSASVTRASQHEVSPAYFAGSGVIMYFPWLLSSAVGFAAGSFIHDPARYGLDFAYVGAFLGLLVAQQAREKQIVAVILAAVASVAAYIQFGTTGAVAAGALASFLYGVMFK